MTVTIKKAVIPAAGLGTRFLPVTRSVPKEMLPIVDTPVIQLVVEEAVASGLTEILIVTSRGKEAIEHHFHRRPDLERRLTEKGDTEGLARFRRLTDGVRIDFVLQGEARGLGHAVGCARAFTGDEPFVVLLGDAIVDAGVPAAAQLIACARQHGTTGVGSVVGVESVQPENVSRYGIVSGTALDERTTRLTGLVEKPAPADAPSDLAIAGRYLLTPAFYEALDDTPPGLGGEVQITDALDRLAEREPMFAWRFAGTRHDVGDKLGYVRAQVEYALKRDAFREPLTRYLRERISELEDGA